MKNLKKGFTLIELLVVIAIIGILSSIVLASLSSARTKGEDAAIQSTLSNMRAQAELYYSNNNDYGPTVAAATTCNTGIFTGTGAGTLTTLVAGAKARSNAVTCSAVASTTWAVSAQMKGDPTKYYCVDASGYAAATTSQVTSTAKCNN